MKEGASSAVGAFPVFARDFFAQRKGQSAWEIKIPLSNEPSSSVRHNRTLVAAIWIVRVSFNVNFFNVFRLLLLVRTWRNCKRSRCRTGEREREISLDVFVDVPTFLKGADFNILVLFDLSLVRKVVCD